ncbi:MAG TPA: DNA-processing protein DprA [Solirubrobacterales bacterium]|jgi:DNA processing protein|nr:DNA-processing protein DprA [Solirubrobacterales bacterium]
MIGFAENHAVGPSRARVLLSLDEVGAQEMLGAEWSNVERRLERKTRDLRRGAAAEIEIWSSCRHRPAFPDALLHLSEPPAALFGAGDRDRFEELSSNRSVAIVGARRASVTGREIAYTMSRELAATGMTIVSGMALGIDGAAHRGALSAAGGTIAVLAGGPERPYPPSHKNLFAEIVATGAVISERPPKSRAMRWGFPARNRIVAALSEGTVLIEGTEKSGALHTTQFADDLGRKVAAVPGLVTSPLSEGPHRMLREYGTLVRGAQDVLELICEVGKMVELPGLEDAEELPTTLQQVLDCVASGDASPQAIAMRLPTLTIRDVVRSLGELELIGRLNRDLSGGYSRANPRNPTR